MWLEYQWIVIVGCIFSFMDAYFIGANDLANSFGTSIGSKTLTLAKACMIASVMEFSGAIALGGEVSKTIAGSIAKPETFIHDPEIFAYGMLCALIAAMSWDYLATYCNLAVSTTHSIVGGVMGFALTWKGSNAIVWCEPINDFPYVKGVVPIIVSWFSSPVISAFFAGSLFYINRSLILRKKYNNKNIYIIIPPLIFLTFFINIFFVLYKGAKTELIWSSDKCAWVAAVSSCGISFILCAIGIPYINNKIKNKNLQNNSSNIVFKINNNDTKIIELLPQDQISVFVNDENTCIEQNHINTLNINDENTCVNIEEQTNINTLNINNENKPEYISRLYKTITYGISQDVHKDLSTETIEMYNKAEIFDPDTEDIYKYVQVFSACCVSFAHGANDVANAAGPFAAIWYVYNTQTIKSVVDTPKWIFVITGSGIVIGLATYGYNIIRTLGVKLLKLTPSRGYCAEIATALTVLFASIYGIPISTTQCIVGAEIGVGLVDNYNSGINWKIFFRTFISWIFTIFITGLISSLLFSQGVYAPSIQMKNDITKYESGIKNIITKNISNININKLYDPTINGYIDPNNILSYLNTKCLI